MPTLFFIQIRKKVNCVLMLLSAFILSATLTLSPTAAKAENGEKGSNIRPYLGVHFTNSFINYATVQDVNFDKYYPNNLGSPKIFAGIRNDNFGLEVGFLANLLTKDSEVGVHTIEGTSIKTRANLESFTADLMGFYPLDKKKHLELIGTVGLATTVFKTKVFLNGATNDNEHIKAIDESEVKVRIGGGIGYQFAENWSMRALVQWQDSNFNNTIDKIILFGLSISYNF